jgi:universal stress protein A
MAWAFDYALRAPCEVHILHVVEDHLSDALQGKMAERIANEVWAVTKEAEAELERMVPDRADRDRIGKIFRHVGRGRAVAEVLRVAEEIGAEMIVMGTHGRSGIARLLIGSVAENVVRYAKCPVVCVKPGQ